MGARGPNKKPAALEMMQGCPGKREKQLKATPDPAKPKSIPKPPDWMSADGKRVWNRTISDLIAVSLFADVDYHTFAMYCHQCGRYIDLQRYINKHGYTMVHITQFGEVVKERPEMAMADRCMTQIIRLGKEFGMSPSARAAISVPTEGDDPLGDMARNLVEHFDQWRENAKKIQEQKRHKRKTK